MALDQLVLDGAAPAGPALAPIILRLPPEVRIEAAPDHITLCDGPRQHVFRAAPGVLSLLQHLQRAGDDEAGLLALYRSQAGEGIPAAFYYVLGRLEQLELMQREIVWQGAPLLRIMQCGPPPRHSPTPADPAACWQLSRFAWLRRREHELLLEAPDAWGRAVLQDRRLGAVLHDLSGPATYAQLAQRSPAQPREALGACLI
jgi:hypothetical protein